MATDIGKVHARSMESFQAALSQEMAAFQTAQLSGDIDECARAAQSMAGLRASMKELDSMAREAYAQQQTPQQSNRWGLSEAEQEVARNVSGDLKEKLTPDQLDEMYARNKARYQQARASGQYRDDQGTVKR